MDMAPWIRVVVLVACLFPASVESMVRHYKFNVSCNGTKYSVPGLASNVFP